MLLFGKRVSVHVGVWSVHVCVSVHTCTSVHVCVCAGMCLCSCRCVCGGYTCVSIVHVHHTLHACVKGYSEVTQPKRGLSHKGSAAGPCWAWLIYMYLDLYWLQMATTLLVAWCATSRAISLFIMAPLVPRPRPHQRMRWPLSHSHIQCFSKLWLYLQQLIANYVQLTLLQAACLQLITI